MKIVVDKDKCTGCGACKEICPKGEIMWEIKDGKAEVSHLRNCLLCTLCASKCPEGAIHVIRDEEYGKKEKIREKN